MAEFILDLVPQGDRNQYHTENTLGQDFRRTLLRTPNQAAPLSMKGRIAEVHHGNMLYEEETCAASLIVLEFRFQSELRDHRYKSVKVVLEFLDQAGHRDMDPEVIELAPDHSRFLNKNKVARNATKGFNLAGKAGIQGAGIEGGVQWTVQESYTKDYSARLIGLPTRSDGKTSGEDNSVAWSMEENEQKGDGVPSFLQTAVLLKHTNRPFYGQLRVQSSVDWRAAARRVLGFSSDEDKIIDPVTFKPVAETPQVRNNRVTGITKNQLASMEQLPVGSYFRVEAGEDDCSGPNNEGDNAGASEGAGIGPGTDAPPASSVSSSSNVTLGANFSFF